MKSRFALLSAVALLVGLTAMLPAEDKADAKEEKKFTATCPVSGGAAKEASFLEVDGKKIYFCCNNCPKAFEKDPPKFAAKANMQTLETGQIVQIGCPFSGGKVNPETVVELGGVKFGFCCNNCKGKFEKTADEEKAALVFTSIAKGFTAQTLCPVSGKAIDPEHMVKYKDQKVFFCCPNCPAAFEKDPAKFEAKLPQLKEKKEEKKDA